MGTWRIIKNNNTFTDIYDKFYELYNTGKKTDAISRKIIDDYSEIIKKEEKNSLWFAIALAQWETKSLDSQVLSTVERIISSGDDLKVWLDRGASKQEIKERKAALCKFLEKIKSYKAKAKSIKTSFLTGDCLTFKLSNGNYGGAVVLASDNNPDRTYNLIATTRLNQITKPTVEDFANAEVMVCNFGEWQYKASVAWYMTDRYRLNYSEIYSYAGRLLIEIEYNVQNQQGRGYLFKPTYTFGLNMNEIACRQFEYEMQKLRPAKKLTIREVIKKRKWWKVF